MLPITPKKDCIETIARFMYGKPLYKESPNELWFTPRLAPHHNNTLHFTMLTNYYFNPEEWLVPVINHCDAIYKTNAKLTIDILVFNQNIKPFTAIQEAIDKKDVNTAVDILTSHIIMIKSKRCSVCHDSYKELNAKCIYCNNQFCDDCRNHWCYCQTYKT